ncbi:MAG: DnaB-like helicase N-terminal domain-containing protein [Pseudomonadota bacterium]
MPDGSQFSEIKVQPHNIEAEQALLGALLLNNEILDRVISLIDQEHFFDPLHGHIYGLIKHFVSKDKLASPVTLKPLISMHEGFKDLGGPAYLVRCAETVISPTAAPEYARFIRDLWARRCAIDVGNQIIDSAGSTQDPDQTADNIIDLAEGNLAKLRTDTTTQRSLISYRDAMAEGLDLASQAYNRGGVPEISTGLDRPTNC